jgi:hypothetical protein
MFLFHWGPIDYFMDHVMPVQPAIFYTDAPHPFVSYEQYVQQDGGSILRKESSGIHHGTQASFDDYSTSDVQGQRHRRYVDAIVQAGY